MNFNSIVIGANKALSKTKFHLKKRSPEILLVTGIVGMVTASVLACKATTKAHEVAENTQKSLEEIEMVSNQASSEEYTEDDRKKDTIIVYSKMVLGYTKLYAPAVILAGLSVTSILVSHNILRKRNIQLATALAGVTKAFDEYRNRVKNKYGEEAENQIRYGITQLKADKFIEDEETGKTKKVKEKIDVFDKSTLGMFAGVFDASSRMWQKDINYNLNFLKMVESQFTNRLKSHENIFLNEIWDALDMPRTEIGQYAGWIYDPDSDISDCFVDLGIRIGQTVDETGSLVHSIIIDPNCDGSIIDRAFKK